jgi:hypothetical protein
MDLPSKVSCNAETAPLPEAERYLEETKAQFRTTEHFPLKLNLWGDVLRLNLPSQQSSHSSTPPPTDSPEPPTAPPADTWRQKCVCTEPSVPLHDAFLYHFAPQAWGAKFERFGILSWNCHGSTQLEERRRREEDLGEILFLQSFCPVSIFSLQSGRWSVQYEFSDPNFGPGLYISSVSKSR